ncbi:MAG: DUF503 domain-containing protein [bacterium]|nr:DUF503 domain-containing protein [Candidatus Sumerlaeota bacterium]
MVIGMMRVRLLIRGANSLKDKRSVLKKTIHRLRISYNCAVAEVDDHDIWRSAILAVVTVCADKQQVDSLFRAVTRGLETAADFEIVEQQIEML